MVKKYFLLSLLCMTTAYSMDGPGLLTTVFRERASRVMVEPDVAHHINEDVPTIPCDEEVMCNTPEEAACVAICLIELLNASIKSLL